MSATRKRFIVALTVVMLFSLAAISTSARDIRILTPYFGHIRNVYDNEKQISSWTTTACLEASSFSGSIPICISGTYSSITLLMLTTVFYGEVISFSITTSVFGMQVSGLWEVASRSYGLIWMQETKSRGSTTLRS